MNMAKFFQVMFYRFSKNKQADKTPQRVKSILRLDGQVLTTLDQRLKAKLL